MIHHHFALCNWRYFSCFLHDLKNRWLTWLEVLWSGIDMKSNPPIRMHMPKTWKCHSHTYIDIFKWSQSWMGIQGVESSYHVTLTNVVSKGVLFEALLMLELSLTYLLPGIKRQTSPIWYDIKWLSVIVVICFVITRPTYQKKKLSRKIVSVVALSSNKKHLKY